MQCNVEQMVFGGSLMLHHPLDKPQLGNMYEARYFETRLAIAHLPAATFQARTFQSKMPSMPYIQLMIDGVTILAQDLRPLTHVSVMAPECLQLQWAVMVRSTMGNAMQSIQMLSRSMLSVSSMKQTRPT